MWLSLFNCYFWVFGSHQFGVFILIVIFELQVCCTIARKIALGWILLLRNILFRFLFFPLQWRHYIELVWWFDCTLKNKGGFYFGTILLCCISSGAWYRIVWSKCVCLLSLEGYLVPKCVMFLLLILFLQVVVFCSCVLFSLTLWSFSVYFFDFVRVIFLGMSFVELRCVRFLVIIASLVFVQMPLWLCVNSILLLCVVYLILFNIVNMLLNFISSFRLSFLQLCSYTIPLALSIWGIFFGVLYTLYG